MPSSRLDFWVLLTWLTVLLDLDMKTREPFQNLNLPRRSIGASCLITCTQLDGSNLPLSFRMDSFGLSREWCGVRLSERGSSHCWDDTGLPTEQTLPCACFELGERAFFPFRRLAIRTTGYWSCNPWFDRSSIQYRRNYSVRGIEDWMTPWFSLSKSMGIASIILHFIVNFMKVMKARANNPDERLELRSIQRVKYISVLLNSEIRKKCPMCIHCIS